MPKVRICGLRIWFKLAACGLGRLVQAVGVPEFPRARGAMGLGSRDKDPNIYAYCNRCNYSAVVPLSLLLVRLGPGHAVPAVGSRMVCRSCGSRDIGTRPHWPDNIGVAAHHG